MTQPDDDNRRLVEAQIKLRNASIKWKVIRAAEEIVRDEFRRINDAS